MRETKNVQFANDFWEDRVKPKAMEEKKLFSALGWAGIERKNPRELALYMKTSQQRTGFFKELKTQ